MILYIMNDFQVSKQWELHSELDSNVVADAMALLKPKEVDGMLHFRAEKWVLYELDMIPIMRVLDAMSSKLDWHYFSREDDVYFQVYVTPLKYES